MKIFLLEDDIIYQDLFKEDLENLGHEVRVHGYVQDAVKTVLEERFDLLIIDISLPENIETKGKEIRDGGIKVLEELILNDEFTLPPVFFVSIYGYDECKERIDSLHKEGMNKGYDKVGNLYLQKPYNSIFFVETVRKIQKVKQEDSNGE